MRALVPLLVILLLPMACERRPSQPDARPLQNGKLVITSEPTGAVVIEDGHDRLGRTPLTLERRAMKRLDLELVKEGYRTSRMRKLVEEGRTLKLHVALRPEQGMLIVRSGLIRGATIMVDDKERGDTPSRVSVNAGRPAMIEVSKPGFAPHRVSVTLSAGETRTLDVVLVPIGKKIGPSGWLTVRSDIPALVHLNGSPLGHTPIHELQLPVGRYRLAVKNQQMDLAETLRIVIRANQTRTVDARLRGR